MPLERGGKVWFNFLMKNHTFGTFLMQEYKNRKKKNPSYSLRAFAKLLEIDQSSLSKFFKGERSFSPATIKSCITKLALDESIRTIIEEDMKNRESDYLVPEEDVMKILSHWKYWAILEFLKIDNTASSSRIANRLHLTENDVDASLKELVHLKFIKHENGRYKLLKPNNNWISNKKTSAARKEFQKQLLKLSIEALEVMPIELREHGSLTVAIDKNKLPEIKEKIRNFQRDLGLLIQKKGDLNEVYQLTISFFPISNPE